MTTAEALTMLSLVVVLVLRVVVYDNHALGTTTATTSSAPVGRTGSGVLRHELVEVIPERLSALLGIGLLMSQAQGSRSSSSPRESLVPVAEGLGSSTPRFGHIGLLRVLTRFILTPIVDVSTKRLEARVELWRCIMRTLLAEPGSSHRAIRRAAAGYRHGTVTNALRSMVATGQVVRVEAARFGSPVQFFAVGGDGAPVVRFGAPPRRYEPAPRATLREPEGVS